MDIERRKCPRETWKPEHRQWLAYKDHRSTIGRERKRQTIETAHHFTVDDIELLLGEVMSLLAEGGSLINAFGIGQAQFRQGIPTGSCQC